MLVLYGCAGSAPDDECPASNPYPYDANGVPGSWCCETDDISSTGNHGNLMDMCSRAAMPCVTPPCSRAPGAPPPEKKNPGCADTCLDADYLIVEERCGDEDCKSCIGCGKFSSSSTSTSTSTSTSEKGCGIHILDAHCLFITTPLLLLGLGCGYIIFVLSFKEGRPATAYQHVGCFGVYLCILGGINWVYQSLFFPD